MEKEYVISESALRVIIGYLETKPYKEVAAGIVALQNLPVLQQESGEEEEHG